MNALFQSENRALVLHRPVSSTAVVPAGRHTGAADGDQSRLDIHGSTQPPGRLHPSAVGELDRWQQLVLCSTEAARRHLPYEIARRFCALPIAVVRESEHQHLISMLMPEEPDPETLKSLRFACGFEIIIDTAPRILIEKALETAYLSAKTEISNRIEQANKLLKSPENQGWTAEKTAGAVPELLRSIIASALVAQASDIHIEPEFLPGKNGYSVRFRVDGRLILQTGLPLRAQIASAIFRRIKVLAQVDTTALRVPIDGALNYMLGRGSSSEVIRLRASFVPLVEGEKLVLRILENRLLEDLKTAREPEQGPDRSAGFIRLGLTADQERIFRWSLAGDRGAVLLSGPTGSGKSTLLSLALSDLQSPSKTIVAIEDPVERRIQNVTHMEIDRARGLDYRQLLVSVLRQDPDILMLGEIREPSTAAAAFEAALTGKLVLSTIHAASVFEVIFRLLEMGLSPELLSISLRLVCSQRLVALACTACRSFRPAGSHLRRIFSLAPGQEIAVAAGCGQCGGTGAAGRTGIFELLPVTERVRDAICTADSQSLHSSGRLRRLLQCAAGEEGYQPLAMAIRNRMLEGVITAAEALRAAGLPVELAH